MSQLADHGISHTLVGNGCGKAENEAAGDRVIWRTFSEDLKLKLDLREKIDNTWNVQETLTRYGSMNFWIARAQCVYREKMRPRCWSTQPAMSIHPIQFILGSFITRYWLLISITTQVRHHAGCWDEKINQEASEELNSGRRGRWETTIKMLCWNGKSTRCLYMGIRSEGRGWLRQKDLLP